MIETHAPSQEELDIWPENWRATQAFEAMQTQWRIGPMGGFIGLDYASLPPVFEMLGFNRDYWSDTFSLLRIMEREAIDTLAK